MHWEQGASRRIWCKGNGREGQPPSHLCGLLGRGANELNRSVGSASQEVVEFQSSKIP